MGCRNLKNGLPCRLSTLPYLFIFSDLEYKWNSEPFVCPRRERENALEYFEEKVEG